MRNMLVNTLYDIAKNDRNIQLITGDLGYGVLTKFWEELPEQFINAGIAEQNMASVAAGMGLSGKTVFTYSIGNFPTLRCLEQIRNDIAYHNSNVKIVAVGGGFAYGALGMSHHATEDIGVMRSLPGIIIFSPCDPIEVREVTKYASEFFGPCYIRLGKGGEKNIHKSAIKFKVGKAIKILSGDDVAIFSTGGITEESYKAAKILSDIGVSTSLYSFHTIKPIDDKLISKVSQGVKLIVTVEEHNVINGLGSAVADSLCSQKGKKPNLIKIGLKDVYTTAVGSQAYLRKYYKLDSESIVEAIKEGLKNEQ